MALEKKMSNVEIALCHIHDARNDFSAGRVDLVEVEELPVSALSVRGLLAALNLKFPLIRREIPSLPVGRVASFVAFRVSEMRKGKHFEMH